MIASGAAQWLARSGQPAGEGARNGGCPSRVIALRSGAGSIVCCPNIRKLETRNSLGDLNFRVFTPQISGRLMSAL